MADEKQPAETPKTPEPTESPADKPKPELTEDEQMAAYEEDLKNSDWGHQPCQDSKSLGNRMRLPSNPPPLFNAVQRAWR